MGLLPRLPLPCRRRCCRRRQVLLLLLQETLVQQALLARLVAPQPLLQPPLALPSLLLLQALH